MSTTCPACGNGFEPATTGAVACPKCHSKITDALPRGNSEIAIAPRTEDLRTRTGHVPGDSSPKISDIPGLPDKVGRYRIVGKAGAGGFGVVYKAFDDELNRTLALKVMIAGEHATEGTIQRFQRESRSAARLSHPNIVHVYDVGSFDPAGLGTGVLYYFAMEFIEGVTLDKRIRDRPPTPIQAATIARDVAQALDYAHRQGIVHRDVKPGNILIDPEGKPHLADFGLAKAVADDDSITRTGEIIGTATYMPPEQCLGSMRAVDEKSDIYSLGTVLYEMLTRRPPFIGETFVAILRNVEERDPEPPSKLANVPRDINTICLKAMAKEKARRYATAADFADDLDRFIGGQPIAARSSGTFYRSVKWAKRHPTILTSLALVLLFSVALVALFHRPPVTIPPAPPPIDTGDEKLARFRQAQVHYRQAADDLNIARNTRRVEDRKRRRDLFQKAQEEVDRALTISPEYADARFLRGILRENLNQPEKALADFDHAIRLDPNLADAYFHRATLRLKLVGQKTIQGAPYFVEQDAMSAFPREFKLIKNDIETLQRLQVKPEKALVAEVRCALVFRESVNTLELLGRAVNTNPTFADAYALRAQVKQKNADALDLHDPGRSELLLLDAMEDCTSSLSYDPNFSEALKTRASIAIRLNRPIEAERDLEDMVSILPGESQTYLDRAMVFIGGKGCIRWWPQILRDLERAVEIDSANSAARFFRAAWILLGGRSKEMIEEVRKCRDEFEALLVEQPALVEAHLLRLVCDYALFDETSFEAHYNLFRTVKSDLSDEKFMQLVVVVRISGDQLRAPPPKGRTEGGFRDAERMLYEGAYVESDAKLREVLKVLDDPVQLQDEVLAPAKARQLRARCHYYLACLAAWRGEKPGALDALARAISTDTAEVAQVFSLLDLCPLRGDAAFEKIAQAFLKKP